MLFEPVRALCAAAGQNPLVPQAANEEDLQQRVARLIAQLGDDDYHRREAAQRALAEIGADAFDALLDAVNHDDLEIATRARYLLRLIPAQWNIEDQPEEVRELLDLYGAQPPAVRVQVIRLLGRVPKGNGWAALCRMVRFEQDSLWSKRVAVQLIVVEPMDQAGRARWAETVESNVGRSSRPAAKWLRNHVQSRRNPQQAIDQWRQLIEAERAALQHQPDQTDPAIVAALWYFLAIACGEQGQADAAAEAARRAQAAGPARIDVQAVARLEMAIMLQRHGRFDWAESEYRRLIQSGEIALAMRAAHGLAEMLYDCNRPAEAAAVLDELLDLMKKNRVVVADESGTTPTLLQARRDYYLACHWKQQGDLEKHRQYVEQALRSSADELDSLIARFHLPEASPEYRRATERLIDAAVARLREEIAQAADEPSAYNQLAWLVGNTTGDLDEALQCARRATEINPDEAAYLDTLAHVCFTRGELEDAVRYQAQAAEREPHSGFIRRELERFRAALDAKSGDKRQQ